MGPARSAPVGDRAPSSTSLETARSGLSSVDRRSWGAVRIDHGGPGPRGMPGSRDAMDRYYLGVPSASGVKEVGGRRGDAGSGVLPRSGVSVRLRCRRLVVVSFHLLFVVLFVPGSVRRCNTGCRWQPLHGIERAADAAAARLVEDRGVDHGRRDVLVTEESLDGPDVVAVLQEVGREGMTKRMAGGRLRQLRGRHGCLDGALDDRLVEVVPADRPRAWVAASGGGGKDVLPGALPGGARVLLREGTWQEDLPVSLGEVGRRRRGAKGASPGRAGRGTGGRSGPGSGSRPPRSCRPRGARERR